LKSSCADTADFSRGKLMANQKERFFKIRDTLVFVLFLNWAVALIKIIVGYLSNSTAIRADGFHSVSDGLSNVLGLSGIWFASQPIDTDHPYGHKKYETLASLGIAFLLFMVSFDIISNAFVRFFNPVLPKLNAVSFIIMIVTLGVNIWVVNYEMKIGKDLDSDILISDSAHTRADVLLTCSVIIGMVVIKLGHAIVDPIVAVIISFFIAHSAIDILRKGSKVLCDQIAIDSKIIEDLVKKVEGVIACHKIRTRGRRDDIHIDLHIQLADQTPLVKAHQISYRVEEEIKKQIPGATDVVVHIEPAEDKNKPNIK